jgi:hypothetical protein
MDKRPAPVVRGDALAHKAHNACAVAGAANGSIFGDRSEIQSTSAPLF